MIPRDDPTAGPTEKAPASLPADARATVRNAGLLVAQWGAQVVGAWE